MGKSKKNNRRGKNNSAKNKAGISRSNIEEKNIDKKSAEKTIEKVQVIPEDNTPDETKEKAALSNEDITAEKNDIPEKDTQQTDEKNESAFSELTQQTEEIEPAVAEESGIAETSIGTVDLEEPKQSEEAETEEEASEPEPDSVMPFAQGSGEAEAEEEAAEPEPDSVMPFAQESEEAEAEEEASEPEADSVMPFAQESEEVEAAEAEEEAAEPDSIMPFAQESGEAEAAKAEEETAEPEADSIMPFAQESEEAEAAETEVLSAVPFGAGETIENTVTSDKEGSVSLSEEMMMEEIEEQEESSEEEAPDPEKYFDPSVVIEAEMLDTVNFALQQNGIRVIKSIMIRNGSDEALKDVEIEITSFDELCLPYIAHIDYIPAKSDFEIRNTDLKLNGEKLVSVNEAVRGHIVITLTKDGFVVNRTDREINILAYDECIGFGIYPELLCSFVTPNHPDVIKIITDASKLLEEWTDDPSFTAYQRCDPNAVLKQAAAIYGAIEKQNIVYSVPPASFEKGGQRIRMCDAVLEQKLGTCLDMTLLYASALELVGLHPILILCRDHIFAGVWLEDMTFPEAVQDDPSMLSKKLAQGINEVAVIECTCMNAGRETPFDEAAAAAERKIPESLYVIDVKRARLSGIRPIPMRIKADGEWKVERSERSADELTAVPKELDNVISIEETARAPLTKKQQWERKLLDLGLRNSLINFRMSKTTVPLMTDSIDELENALADGEDFSILPRPEDMKISGNVSFDNLGNMADFKDIIHSEFKNHRLRSVFTEKELTATIKEIYRSSKVSMEENGANTLYIALGLLKWFETSKSTKARYAPVLLLPIEIVRKSAAKGYVIRLRDDDAVVNITLLEKLKQDFEIDIQGLDPLPLDEHGIDTRKVFTIIRKAVMEKKNWDISESAYLGIFSFSQFVMWNDIRNRSEELAENKIVKSLMDGKLAWQAEEMDMGKRVPEDDVLLPLPADASQLFAIESAGKGESFVLHGPPGTGKSQTITALIANALAQGKTVLFVAEKMAALEVVQRRLDKIGIGDFCLELHSNKSKKKAVLEQLKKASEVTKTKSRRSFAVKAQALSELRHELDVYAGALHRRQPCGKSLYHLLNDYESNEMYPELPPFDEDLVKHIDQDKIEKQEIMLERLIAAAKGTGHPKDHPLSPVGVKVYSQHFKMQLPSKIAAYKTALENIGKPLMSFAGSANVPADTYAASQLAVQLAKEAAVWFDLPKAWAKNDNLTTYMFGIWELCEHHINAKQIKDELGSSWKDDFYTLDGRGMLNEFRDVSAKWFLAKSIGISKIHKKLSQYSTSPVNKENIEKILTDLTGYQSEKQEADRLDAAYLNDLGSLYNGNNTDWQEITRYADKAKESAQKLNELTGSDEFRMSYCGNTEAREIIPVLTEAWEKLEAARNDFYGILEIRNTDEENWIENEIKMCDNIGTHLSQMKEWITWNDISEEAETTGLAPAVQAYREGISHNEIKGAYIKTISKALAIKAIDGSSALNKFSGPVFNEKIAQFRRMDQEITELTKEEIYCRLAAKIPNFAREAAQSSELGILQKAIRSGGRGISIRKLFDQIPNMLKRLCPCMLMSPISAAQYLDPKREPFDLVVFDEASQLPTCKAVGVLARGKDAVIVGDPKQMPPTSFFSTTSVDEDNLDVEDLESILDDCLALNMPQTHLLWHYRSRHESLIAFSNHEFYENKLYTFPSVNDREAKVRLVHVDGIFERGKTRNNMAEAQAIVEELKRRAHDEVDSAYSVGIVTFNVNQQNLIDDLLTEACKDDAELENWVNREDEPLFIKNLENVQGDERDVILFSIAYGPDKDGRVSMNFGPLNRDGGWRRLNVAVSRARCEMIVYSSMTADMIDLSRTSADGVAALRSFLEYAAGKTLVSDSNSVTAEKNKIKGIADTICRHIEDQGYKTDRMVGNSEYRIDIGVIDPSDPEKYLLGILLDGPAYGKSKTTRDRELAQVSILDGLGWKLMRIWSMDWWDNKDKELSRIDEMLDKLKNGITDEPEYEEDIPAFTPPDDVEEEPIENYKVTKLSIQTATPEEVMSQKMYSDLRKKLRKTIENEAPINKELVIKRVTESFDILRSTPKLHRYIDDTITAMTYPKTKQGEEVLIIWSDEVKPTGYSTYRPDGKGDYGHREITDVPYAEAANAVLAILYDEVSLPKADLIKESAKLMNYRMGSNVAAVFTAAVDLLLEKKLAFCDENEICSLTTEGFDMMVARG